jgi:hypothetical protein
LPPSLAPKPSKNPYFATCQNGDAQNNVILPPAKTAMPKITLFCHLPKRQRPKQRYFAHRQNGRRQKTLNLPIAKTATTKTTLFCQPPKRQ